MVQFPLPRAPYRVRAAEAQARLGPPVDTEVLFEPSVDRPDMGETPVPGELVAVLHWCCSTPMLYRVAKHVQKHKGVEMLTVDGERPGAWKAFYYSRLRRVDRPLAPPDTADWINAAGIS